MIRSVRDIVRDYYERDCWKHNLAPDPEAFADERINSMSNCDLLDAISAALEERLRDEVQREKENR